MYDVVVIGAGASGCYAAIVAAKAGSKVLILEKNEQILKKLFATGNGKCNFTNEMQDESCYRGNLTLYRDVYSQYGKQQILQDFYEIGIYPKAKKGYYYPNSEQAGSVVTALSDELYRLGVQVITGCNIAEIIKNDRFFVIYTPKEEIKASSIIISCGLLAAPKLGSDGSLFELIKDFGHSFVPIVPALCPFYCEGMDFKRVSGVRSMAKVMALIDAKLSAENMGEVQFTEYGLSGIPIFQISRYLSYGLYEHKKVEIEIELLPEIDEQKLNLELARRMDRIRSMNKRPIYSIALILNGLLPQKLSEEYAIYLQKQESKDITDEELKQKLIELLKHRCVKVLKPRSFEFAQVCAGGIMTEELDTRTLESKLVPGLFFAGEILDIDGICGGYNLQWAWSSGYVAGLNASTYRV